MSGLKVFAVGDAVTFRAGRAGLRYQGKVEHLVPPGEYPPETLVTGAREYGRARPHKSYVTTSGGRFYWPEVVSIERAVAPRETRAQGAG